MNKILSLFAVLLLSIATYAGTPTAPTTFSPGSEIVPYSGGRTACLHCSGKAGMVADTAIRIAVAGDTTIFTKVVAEPGYAYVVSLLDSVVTDSCRVIMRAYGSNGTTLMQTVDVDTIHAAGTYKDILLPIGISVEGAYFSVSVTGIGSTTKKITYAELRRKVAAVNQNGRRW